MELSEIVDFPIGGVAVLVGILALVIMDSSLTALWAPKVRPPGCRAGRIAYLWGRAGRAAPARGRWLATGVGTGFDPWAADWSAGKAVLVFPRVLL
jgi:hypothetical protein